MYLPTMPEDNLLEAMNAIRDVKFYGKVYHELDYSHNISPHGLFSSVVFLASCLQRVPMATHMQLEMWVVPVYDVPIYV